VKESEQPNVQHFLWYSRVTNEPSTVKNDVEEIKSEDVAMETSSAAANARVYSGTFSESGNMVIQ